MTGAAFLCECGINLLRGLFTAAGEAFFPACEAAFGLGGSGWRFAFAGEGPDCGGRFPVYGPLGDQHPLVRFAGEFVVDRVGDVPDDVAETADACLEFFCLSGDFHEGVVGIFEVVPGPAEHFLEFFGRGDVGLPEDVIEGFRGDGVVPAAEGDAAYQLGDVPELDEVFRGRDKIPGRQVFLCYLGRGLWFRVGICGSGTEA